MNRQVGLDLSSPNLGAHAGNGYARGDGGLSGQPDPRARDNFEQALHATQSREDAQSPAAQASNPFALFGSVAAAPPAADRALSRQLNESLQRLMVDDAVAGGKQVRMELAEDVLPGVTVTIQEKEGRVQVDFICAAEASRLRLNAALPEQAPLLAERLRRDVLLRVQADDEDDPCLFELAASA